MAPTEEYTYRYNAEVLRCGGRFTQPVRGRWEPVGGTQHYNFVRDSSGDSFACWDPDYGWQHLPHKDVEVSVKEGEDEAST